MTRRGLLGLLGSSMAGRAAAPRLYGADVMLMSSYRVLEWSRTPATFVHDEEKHEFRTPRRVEVLGKEAVVVDQCRILFGSSPDHLDGLVRPRISVFAGKLVQFATSVRYSSPDEKQRFLELFEPSRGDKETAKSNDDDRDEPKPVRATQTKPVDDGKLKVRGAEAGVLYAVFRNGQLLEAKVYSDKSKADKRLAEILTSVDARYRENYWVDKVSVIE